MADQLHSRIFVVDDDHLFVKSVRRILREHDTSAVPSLAEALSHLADDQDYDLILCDLQLLDGSGMELDAQVSERWPTLQQRIVYVTGGARSEKERRFLDRADIGLPGLRRVYLNLGDIAQAVACRCERS